ILGALSLFIAFIAFQVIPIHAGGLALLLAGMALVIAEVFLMTGGALALGGSIAFVLGLLWFVDTDSTDLTVSFEVWLAISTIFAVCVAVLVWAGIRMKRLNREAVQTAGSASLSGLDGYVATVHRVNENGLSGQIYIR